MSSFKPTTVLYISLVMVMAVVVIIVVCVDHKGIRKKTSGRSPALGFTPGFVTKKLLQN